MKLVVNKMMNRLVHCLAVLFAATAVHAQDARTAQPKTLDGQAPVRMLSDNEVKATYRTCPGGWYGGPQPGKARYVKDPWLWVVTPEFAKRFCMPAQLVSSELKGAEAIAFRLLRKSDDENCGFGGNPNACSAETVLRFDIYIKSEVRLPRTHQERYFQSSLLPSAGLISGTPVEIKALGEQTKREPVLALKPHFEGQQIGLQGIKDGIIAWPIVSLYQQTHFGGVFDSIDYYAFEGLTGFFENPGIKQNNVTQFAVVFKRLDRDKSKKMTGQPLTDMAHVIEMPKAFTDKIAEADIHKGQNIKALMREAFSLPAVPSASAGGK